MKTVAVVTTTRAEYGLLAPVIKQLRKNESADFRVELIVTGTHLYDSYGLTVNEIKADNVRIDREVKIPVNSKTKLDISKNQAQTLVSFSELFLEKRYKAVVLLGDRYETLAIAIAASNTLTPIFHLCGGDTTQGAVDEWIRHSITKMSYLHFVTNEISQKRVIQLGESPERVFNYGSTSIDNIQRSADLSKYEALNSIGLEKCNQYAVCTYHPVTMEDVAVDDQMHYFLNAIKAFPDIDFIVTKSNADCGGARINEILDQAQLQISNLHVYSSLGMRRYLSLMKHSCFVLGNSSSGIIEAPSFRIPTVNIGDRQKGRLQAESIINCTPDTESIVSAIQTALSFGFLKKIKDVKSPYGNGDAYEKIASKIMGVVMNERIDLKKSFYDISIE